MPRTYCHVSNAELITCSKSTHAIHQGFPLRLYFLSPLSPLYWRILETGILKSLTLSYFWNCSWEFVTLAKVSHLQPFFSPGLMMNKSVLHVAFLFSKVYVAINTERLSVFISHPIELTCSALITWFLCVLTKISHFKRESNCWMF